MKTVQLLSNTYSFLRLHLVVVLMVTVIIAGSVLSILLVSRRTNVEPASGPRPRRAQKVALDEGLPPRKPGRWGINPFRDAIKEREFERKKRQEEARREAQEEARRKAQELATKEAQEQARRDAEEAARKEAEEKRKREEQLARERKRRKEVILSIRIDGIMSDDTHGGSTAIVEGKLYRKGDVFLKDKVEIKVEAIDPNGVVFKDVKSGNIYKVPFSR